MEKSKIILNSMCVVQFPNGEFHNGIILKRQDSVGLSDGFTEFIFVMEYRMVEYRAYEQIGDWESCRLISIPMRAEDILECAEKWR